MSYLFVGYFVNFYLKFLKSQTVPLGYRTRGLGVPSGMWVRKEEGVMAWVVVEGGGGGGGGGDCPSCSSKIECHSVESK